jgi:subtilase family serine protease
MPIQTLRRVLTVTLLLLPLTAFAAGPANRIARTNMTATAAVPNSVHPLARPEFDNGAVDDAMPLSGLTIQFQRSAAQQSALETLIAGQNDPSSPLFHKWLTPEEFATQFGMSAQDIATATSWLTSQGFSVVKVMDSGNAIIFTGTAGHVRHAFGTEIHHYNVKGAMHYANAGAVTLPAALANVVASVSGLNDFHPTPQFVRSGVTAGRSNISPLFTSGITGSHFLAPGDFSTIYDTKGLLNGGFTGAGVTIGIAGETDIILSDIAAFRAAAGLPVNNPTVVLKPGSGDPGTLFALNLPEADLDLEWSGGIAPNANIVYLNSTDAFDSLAYGIQSRVTVNGSNILIPILSISFGNCEANIGMPLESVLQQAAAQGQTVIAAAGDSGAADCDNQQTVSTRGLAVDYPASSPFVTGIGGTEFNEGTTTGATAFWNGNVSGTSATDVVSSAISYIPEMAWNDTPNSELGDVLAGGGGGASILFTTKPSWQVGVPGIPADGRRDVPDIALNASPVHDGYLICTEIQLTPNSSQYSANCQSGFRIASGSPIDPTGLEPIGGTSVGAPSFAGVLALIEQKLGAPQGLINPALYSIASNPTMYASDFHDVTVGSNKMPCSGGTGCVSGQVGFTAGTGYDEATGLGSIDASNLSTDFATYVINHGGKIGTTDTLTVVPTTPTIGQATTFTATVTPNSGSVPPTGTVTFNVDGVATSAGAVPLVSGVATTAFTFTTGGTHRVIANYSGDNNNYASISPTVTISNFNNAGGAAATTTVLTTSSSTATLFTNNSPAYTAVVSSATTGTLAGTTVTFTVGSGSSAVSTPVTLGSNTTGVSTSSCTTSPASCTATLLATVVTAGEGYPAAGGSAAVVAHYDGNVAYQQSTSNTLSITVSDPAYTISVPTIIASATATGVAGTSTLTLTSTGGFADPVTLILSTSPNDNINFCYGLPEDPVTAVANSSVAVQLTIAPLDTCANGVTGGTSNVLKSTGGSASLRQPGTHMARGAGAVLAVLCLAGCFARRRRGVPRLMAVAMIVLLGGLLAGAMGCGGYASSSFGGVSQTLPAGTYVVTVTGTDARNSLVPAVTTTFTLIVQ